VYIVVELDVRVTGENQKRVSEGSVRLFQQDEREFLPGWVCERLAGKKSLNLKKSPEKICRGVIMEQL